MNALQEEFCALVEAAGMTLDKTNNNQVLAALRQMLRFKLTQDEYLYISPTGDDTHDGLTQATALRTGQAAWNKALLVDLGGHNLYLQFADGTYTDPILCSGRPLGLGINNSVVLQGNVALPNNVVFAPSGTQSCITAADGADVFVTGVTLQAAGNPSSYQNMGMGLVAATGGNIVFGNVDFGACSYAQMQAIGGGVIQSGGNPYRIMGGGQFHMIAALGGYLANVNSPVAITGTPDFSGAFAYAQTGSVLATYGAAYSGAATGKRYNVTTNSTIVTASVVLPGSVAGTADAATFGVYI
jgi:hypothetical protein